MKYTFALLILISSSAFSLTEKSSTFLAGDVDLRRMHSVTHQNDLARNMYMFFVDGLQEGCRSLYLYPESDPFLFAAVLSGLSGSKTEKISTIYHIDVGVRGPWGDATSCQLTSFTVEK